MIGDAAAGVASLGGVLKLALVVFIVATIFSVFIDGSNMRLIRRAREQQRSRPPGDEQ